MCERHTHHYFVWTSSEFQLWTSLTSLNKVHTLASEDIVENEKVKQGIKADEDNFFISNQSTLILLSLKGMLQAFQKHT